MASCGIVCSYAFNFSRFSILILKTLINYVWKNKKAIKNGLFHSSACSLSKYEQSVVFKMVSRTLPACG